MPLSDYSELMLPAVEIELKRQLGRLDAPATRSFREMVAYHMGWSNAQGEQKPGKRVRPLLMLLVVEACGGEWLRAVAPAAAIEFVHNFSLVHDDIEDNSPIRRGRPTVWKQYGLPMAVNIGDAIFTISNLAMLDAAAAYPAAVTLRAASCLHAACLALTKGQFLDMAYEKRSDLALNDYWPMVEGKTAALLAACGEIGAILGGADDETMHRFGEFGYHLGLAFQVQDDLLGIWGDEKAVGKSIASDLVEGKNSLPILYGVGRSTEFAQRWATRPFSSSDIPAMARLLEQAGAQEFCKQEAARQTDLARQALAAALPRGNAAEALTELANTLLGRAS